MHISTVGFVDTHVSESHHKTFACCQKIEIASMSQIFSPENQTDQTLLSDPSSSDSAK